MAHLLDNPIWNALLTGNSSLAMGEKSVKFFEKEVSPFAALERYDRRNLERLYEVVSDGQDIALFTDKAQLDLTPWNLTYNIDCYQMIFPDTITGFSPTTVITRLRRQHVPEMLALTHLTEPGPFFPRTIEFGHYEGIFSGGSLVAMAGLRLHAGDFIEISAVCTHPEFTGKGLAKELIQSQISFIQQNGGIPYLHVRTTNDRAFRLYEHMGFIIRKEIYVYVIKKSKN